MQYLKMYFLFASAVFLCLSNDITLNGLFLHHCVVFSLFCVALVISEPRAYFRPDFATIRRKKFAAGYFWFKAKLKQKTLNFNNNNNNNNETFIKRPLPGFKGAIYISKQDATERTLRRRG